MNTYSQNKTLFTPKLKAQLELAKRLLYKYENDEISMSDVFDTDKLAKYADISHLFGAVHTTTLLNGRKCKTQFPIYLHDVCVLEFKYDLQQSDEVAHVTNHFPYRITKNSKYVTGINLTQLNERNY